MSHLLRIMSAVLVAVLLACPTVHVSAQDDALATVSAERYVVVDAETGEVFAQQDADVRGGMASLTKLFTIMEAIDRAPLDTEITAVESDLFGPDSTSMTGFSPGVTFTLDDLLHGMMLESGNDAAVAVARTLGAREGDTDQESVDRFVGWMNERVASLGLRDTQLKNPHGLSEKGHHTTPRDLAAFLMYATTNHEFVRVLTDRSFTTSTGVELVSINRGPEFIPDYIGGKTGFDEETGYCLAEVADRDGREMIAVSIDGAAPDTWYVDHATLFDVAYAGLEARLAEGLPLPENRVAFVAPGRAVAQAAADDAEQAGPTVTSAEDPPSVSIAPVPTAVRVDSLPQPAVDPSSTRSISGNWVRPLSIAVGLIALLGLRRLGGATPGRPVDTPREAS